MLLYVDSYGTLITDSAIATKWKQHASMAQLSEVLPVCALTGLTDSL